MWAVTSLEHPLQTGLYSWWTAAVSLTQATKQVLWRHSCDVRVLVVVGSVWYGVVACATPLDAIEDDTDEYY